MAPLHVIGARVAPAIAVLAALVSAPLLPPQHLHRAGVEGRGEPLVHAHAVPLSDSSRARRAATALDSSHGDHRLAVFLNDAYTRPEAGAGCELAAASAVVISPPTPDSHAARPPGDTDRIHGPPPSASITRAPPILS